MDSVSNNNTYNSNLGKNIKEIRTGLSLTQEEFAEMLNINSQFLSKIETGKVGISLDTAINICNCAKCSSGHLFKNIIKSPSIIDEYDLLSERDRLVVNQMITYLLNTK